MTEIKTEYLQYVGRLLPIPIWFGEEVEIYENVTISYHLHMQYEICYVLQYDFKIAKQSTLRYRINVHARLFILRKNSTLRGLI